MKTKKIFSKMNEFQFRFGPIESVRRSGDAVRQEVEPLVVQELDPDQQPPTNVVRESTRRCRQKA